MKPPSFGEKLMKKMGWSPGEGLGKEKNGISTYVRVYKRNHTRGLGMENRATVGQLGDMWWDKMYNQASKEITKKQEGSDSSDSSSDDDQHLTKISDADLFAACGGRTCRHRGLFGKGKLNRLDAQDATLLSPTPQGSKSEVQRKSRGDLQANGGADRSSEVPIDEKILKSQKLDRTSNSVKKKRETRTCADKEAEEVQPEKKKRKRGDKGNENVELPKKRRKQVSMEGSDQSIHEDQRNEKVKKKSKKAEKSAKKSKKEKKKVSVEGPEEREEINIAMVNKGPKKENVFMSFLYKFFF
eukprot:Rmarinus@m.3079